MLEARDGAIARNRGDERSKSGMAPSRDKEAYLPPTSAASICNLYWSPTWLIDHEEDQGWEPTGDSDSDDDDGGMGLQSNVASDRKVQELLERYLADEEDGEIVRSLVNAGKESEREVGNSGDKKGVEDKYKENLQEDVEAREDDEEKRQKVTRRKKKITRTSTAGTRNSFALVALRRLSGSFYVGLLLNRARCYAMPTLDLPYGILSRHRRTLKKVRGYVLVAVRVACLRCNSCRLF